MATAREKAHASLARVSGDRMAPNMYTQRLADAASDVWEPILRDLVEAIGKAGWSSSDAGPIFAAYNAAREALGD